MIRNGKLQVASCDSHHGGHVAPSSFIFLRHSSAAFTILELSVVVLILALIAAAALRYAASTTYANNVAATNDILDTIEATLANYRYMYGRLPCPTDITQVENTTAFGLEAGTSTNNTGAGECYTSATYTPHATYQNGVATTDPDYTATLNTAYDSTTAQVVEAGGVPTKTLRLADKYAYDAWGRKILYVVDKRITATNAFTTYSANSSPVPSSANCYDNNAATTCTNNTVGAIVIKRSAGDSLTNAITYKAIYALVSFGANGHGAYVRNLASTGSAQIKTAWSTNADEQKNCHCDNWANATAFDRDFVQHPKSASGAAANLTSTTSFDDIVRFKTRNEMVTYSEMQ